MLRTLRCVTGIMAAVVVSTLLLATGGLAQTALPRLGLSAAPDMYVGTIDVASDEPFDLYIIAKGPDGLDILPFDLVSLQWAVFTPCCGASYDVLDVQYNPDLEHVGFPFTGVESSSEICIEDDFLYLATLTLIINVDGPGAYLLPAGATGPAFDCADESHLFLDLTVEAHVDGGITPNSYETWGGLKGIYR